MRQTRGAKNIPKTVLKSRLKTKEITCTLISKNALWSLSQPTQRGNFQCFWNINFILSQEPDVLEKIQKQIRTQRTKIKQESLIFFNTPKFVA
jgi:hypothetical protein